MEKITPGALGIILALIPGVSACESGPADGEVASRGSTADTPAVAAPASGTESGYTPTSVVDGGTLRGVVRFVGDLPSPRTVQVEGDTAVCGTTRRVRSMTTDRDGGLADAVVSLVDIHRGTSFSRGSTPTLDQRDCRFHPQVIVSPAGGTIRVLNSDPLTHNVHTAAFDNRSVNRSQPPGSGAIELSFDTPEKIRVKCDLHPWMKAWIVVAAHPYHAVTDASGAFELSDVPPGTYTLEIWHEALGTRSRTVTAEAAATTELIFDVTAEGVVTR